MKLKKIASLMLAGVMTVSMMTAGSGKSADDTEEKPPVVDPVDDTFAASVNENLSTAEKNTITFSSNSTLASVLDKVAGVISSDDLTPYYAQGWSNVYSVDAMDMRTLLGIDEENSMVSAKEKLFKDTATDVTKAADVFVVDGSYTESGVAQFVADAVSGFINDVKLPLQSKNGDYRYSYTGDIACVKVTNLSGRFESYVVAFTMTQTPTRIANGTNNA